MRNKEIMFLIAFMLIFSIIFIMAILGFIQGEAIFDIGLSPVIINVIVMVLSFFAMIKTITHMHIHY